MYRISADAIKANWLRENRFWTESRPYDRVKMGNVRFGVMSFAVAFY